MFCSNRMCVAPARLFIVIALASGLLGCAGAGGSALVPAKQKLLPSTKAVRDCGPCERPLPRELSKAVLADYILEPGDGVLVEPVQFDTPLRLPADQVILADGTIDLGRFGRVVIAGRTIAGAEALVEEAILLVEPDLEEDERQVNVRLIDPQSKIYYVMGEVVAPGSFPLIGRETVLDAILAAGGVSDRASTCDIILSRPTGPDSCRIVIPICLNQIVQLGDTTTNYQIMPGDRIFVASRSFWDCLNPWDSEDSCPCCNPCHCPCPAPMGMAPPTSYATPGPIFEPGRIPEEDEPATPPMPPQPVPALDPVPSKPIPDAASARPLEELNNFPAWSRLRLE